MDAIDSTYGESPTAYNRLYDFTHIIRDAKIVAQLDAECASFLTKDTK